MSRRSRVFYRLPFEFKISILPANSDTDFSPARSLDISSNGMGFLTDRKLDQDAHVIVRFTLPGRFKAFTIRSVVRRQTDARNGEPLNLNTGVEFLPDTDDAMIRTISNFIINQTDFVDFRNSVLIWGCFLALLLTTGVLHLMTYQYFLELLSCQRYFFAARAPFPAFFSALHFLFAAGWLASAVGIYFFKPVARKSMLFFATLGAMGRAGILYEKTAGFASTSMYAAHYLLECVYLLAFLYLVYELSNRSFAKRYDNYLKNLESHLSY